MELSFTERLQRCMTRGQLTVADIARLFDRERRTVSDWVHKGRLPTGAREQEALDRLLQLEQAIRQKRGFPVPLRLSKRNRVKYVQLVGEGKLGDARVLAEGAAA
jgi:transposase-like protein